MNSISDVWQSVLSRLQEQLSETTIRTWFDEVDVVTMEDSAFVLHCSNSFKKSTIETRFMKHIKAALKDIFSSDLEVKILNDEQLAAYHGVAPDQPGSLLDSDAFTFETYVVGPQNKLAYAAARAVADKPAENFNPLFIYGDSGLGKTHLLYAIAHQVKRKREDLRIVYIKGDDFTNELIETLRMGDPSGMTRFREKYRNIDVLLIDDVQYFQGKKQTLDIVFQIFNKMTDQGKQVVLSADRAPKNIDIDERYITRFNSGGTFDIQPPEIETKLGIVKSFIEEYRESEGDPSFSISSDIQMYIAENSSSNIRELKSAVTKIIYQMAFTHNSDLTLDDVRGVLESHFSGGPSKRLAVADIQREVENYYKISHSDMVGKKRPRHITYARKIAMYLCRQMLDLPFNDIGKKFNRDHTTVLYSVSDVEKQLKESRDMNEEIEALKMIIRDL